MPDNTCHHTTARSGMMHEKPSVIDQSAVFMYLIRTEPELSKYWILPESDIPDYIRGLHPKEGEFVTNALSRRKTLSDHGTRLSVCVYLTRMKELRYKRAGVFSSAFEARDSEYSFYQLASRETTGQDIPKLAFAIVNPYREIGLESKPIDEHDYDDEHGYPEERSIIMEDVHDAMSCFERSGDTYKHRDIILDDALSIINGGLTKKLC
jgi:hypothetical protein